MRFLMIFLAFVVMGISGCVSNDLDKYPYTEKIENLTGLKIPSRWKPAKDAVFFAQGVGLPREFDWREKGLSPVENQGSCGSCWAFATTSVFEDNVILATGREVDFSEQYLVDCVREAHGCNGGWSAHEYHINKGFKGAVAASRYPYKGRDGKCQSGHKAIDKIVEWKEVSNDVNSIKHAIYNYGPVWTTIYATNSVQNYQSGIFNRCREGRSNHAVTLVGWNDIKKYWIMKNSWGKNWGEEGYMRIPYDCNNIGYASNFVVYKEKPKPEPDPEPCPPCPEPDPEPNPDPNPKPWWCRFTPWLCR